MTRPDYPAIVTALHARFATLPGLLRLDANNVNQAILDYEPDAMQDRGPTLYSLYDHTIYAPSSSVNATHYFTLHRLLFQWQDPMMAERALRPYIDSLPLTVNLNKDTRRLDLAGGMSRGIATVGSCQGGFVMIGGTLCRCLDFMSEVLTK